MNWNNLKEFLRFDVSKQQLNWIKFQPICLSKKNKIKFISPHCSIAVFNTVMLRFSFSFYYIWILYFVFMALFFLVRSACTFQFFKLQTSLVAIRCALFVRSSGWQTFSVWFQQLKDLTTCHAYCTTSALDSAKNSGKKSVYMQYIKEEWRKN